MSAARKRRRYFNKGSRFRPTSFTRDRLSDKKATLWRVMVHEIKGVDPAFPNRSLQHFEGVKHLQAGL
jgi:hypothetical protein